MDKKNALNKFSDMVDSHLETIKEYANTEGCPETIQEVLVYMHATAVLTELTEEEINEYIKNKTGFEVDELNAIYESHFDEDGFLVPLK